MRRDCYWNPVEGACISKDTASGRDGCEPEPSARSSVLNMSSEKGISAFLLQLNVQIVPVSETSKAWPDVVRRRIR